MSHLRLVRSDTSEHVPGLSMTTAAREARLRRILARHDLRLSRLRGSGGFPPSYEIRSPRHPNWQECWAIDLDSIEEFILDEYK